ncbi:MAG: NAD(P)/FAD-dependent oxidoreductase, partial [Actinobacteria bacterium]|nr:NAD(P)/FAD-dependent oxidoreductase [Actinomycetota bacterium]
GVIGTGSTAIQITGALVAQVERLELFQRTPQWIMPVDNQPFSDDQKNSFRDHPEALRELRDFLETTFAENFADAVVDAESENLDRIEEACRANLVDHVADPDLRRRLEPDYRAACKRLVISGDFYDAIQQPNAELVTSPIVRIEPGGIRTDDGRLHELDVIVLATGFQVDRFMRPTVDLDSGVPESIHAQRTQRPGRELLADPGRGTPDGLHHATRRSPAVG